jgi:O-antigen ligase
MPLFILFVIFYFILALFKPNLALFLTFSFLFSYQVRFKIFNLPTNLLECMIIILFFIWLSKIKGIKFKFDFKPFKILILCWLLVSLVEVFVSSNRWLAFGHWRAYFLEPIILCLIFLDLVKKNEKDLEIFLLGLGISGLISSLWAIGQKFFGGGVLSLEVLGKEKIWRATGPFPQPNFLGLYLGPIIFLSTRQILSKSRFRLFYFLTVLLAISSLFLARSEGAILGVFLGFIFLGIFYKKSRKITLIIFVFLVIISLIISPLREFLINKFTFKDLSAQLRLNIWQATISLIKDHLIFGVGLRNYQNVIKNYQKPYFDPKTHRLISTEIHPYPHNLFLALWTELGIFGLFIFLVILFYFFKTLLKRKKIEDLVVVAAMIEILVHGLVDTPYFKNDLAILFWIVFSFSIFQN